MEQLFDLELERVRLRAMRAVERFATQPDDDARQRISDQLATLEARLETRRAQGRAQALGHRLELDDDEVDLLWTTVAIGADPHLLPHLLVLGGNDAKRGLTLATHALIAELDGDRARALARKVSSGRLVRDHILQWSGDAQASVACPLVAPSRTINWLAGSDELDDAMLGAGCVVTSTTDLALDARQRLAVDNLPDLLFGTRAPLVILEGATGTGRRTAIATAAATFGRPVVALDLRRLPSGVAPLTTALVGLHRECRLRDAVPLLLDLHELRGEGRGDYERTLARVIDEFPGPCAATSSHQSVELPVARPIVRVRWNTPDVDTRRLLWARALGADARGLDTGLTDIAMRYGVGAGGVSRAVASGRLIAGRAPFETRHLIEGVRTNIAERLGELAQRQEVRQSWDDLVLAPDIRDQVRMLVSRVRHAHRVLEDWGFSSKLPKGTGVAALFSGAPGTGKTMVAGLIARELGLELYQVDLSKVISKWVGETEKQLAKVFEAAEAGHALLLFDEADSLFAKRTEVKSSNDRHANLEVNYLLQRIESFGGVSILTTNLDASIDPALRRRLAAMVTFWPPDEDERLRLWQTMIASRAPVAADVDLEDLANKYDQMTGANIRNAVLSAAFLAAAEGSALTKSCLERAARGEYAAMGRVIGRK